MSLLETLRGGGYEASLITTFNAYLPFYEEVVLRHLVAAGCRYNLVLMDAAQYRMALGDKHLRPRLAGRLYSLIPVAADGAFHPKLLLLAGRKKGLLHVGSHNLTLSGFGHNRELTNQLIALNNDAHTGIESFRRAFEFARDWLEHGPSPAPRPLLDAFDRFRPFAPWLKSGRKTIASETRFLGSSPQGPPLLDQMQALLPERTRRVIVTGPFFDRRLEFLHRLASLVPDAELIIAVDPESVELTNPERAPAKSRFVLADNLADSDGYLHAKALLFEGAEGETVLVTGSANPSSPAWLATKGHANAEAVVVRSGPEAALAARDLGLQQLAENSTAITESQWAEARERSRARDSPDPSPTAPVGIFAIATDEGVELHGGGHLGQDAVARLLDDEETELLRGPLAQSAEEPPHIHCPKETIGRARLVSLETDRTTTIVGHVHHQRAVESLSETSRQTKFRAALASLEGDQPDIAGLLATVNHLIFDDDNAQFKAGKPSARNSAPRTAELSGDLGPLALSLSNATRKQRKRRRLLREGGLASLLEELIYQLGRGLEFGTPGLDKKGRSEEEQRDRDDEEEDDQKARVDAEAWIESCGRKVATMVSRVLRQLANAPPDGDAALRPIMQLFAVLATLRHLRSCDTRARWSEPGRTLVPMKERERLLRGALAHLFGRSRRLLEVTERAVEDATTDELTRLRGLLLWLAWDCGVSFDSKQVFRESDSEVRSRLYNRAVIAALAPYIAVDILAQDEAQSSLQVVAPASAAAAWLERSLAIGTQIAEAVTTDDRESTEVEPRMGDLVVTRGSTLTRVLVRTAGSTARLLDFGEKSEVELPWSVTHLRLLQVGVPIFRSALSR